MVDVPRIIRRSIDEVIDTPRTNRFILAETEKTEKTYLGTKIEILLRSHLRLPKGNKLDLLVGGVEVDIKNTMGTNWSIPTEAVGYPCMLVKEKEKTARCSVGVVLAREEYLNPGANKDAKRTFSKEGRENIWWIVKDYPYPPNFFEKMPRADREVIMAAGRGTKRIMALFDKVQGEPIARLTIEAIAQQKDPLRRIRRDSRRGRKTGARDALATKGVAILWGRNDRVLIKTLGLKQTADDEFIAYKPKDPEQITLLQKAGKID